MGTKCKTGKRRQALRDAVRQLQEHECAWLNWGGYRLKIAAPYLPDEGESLQALVRNGNRVELQTIVGKDAGGRLRVYGNKRRGNPSLVVASVVESHIIAPSRRA